MDFKTARKKTGYSQAEVGKLLGVDQSAVAGWESGRTRPRASILPKVAAIYGCTIDELLAGQTKDGRSSA